MFWHWVRRQYRLRGGPRPFLSEKDAHFWHNASTAGYVFSTWVLLGYVIYLYKRTEPKEAKTNLSGAEYYGHIFGAEQNIQVIKMENFSHVGNDLVDMKKLNERLNEEKKIKDLEFYGVSS